MSQPGWRYRWSIGIYAGTDLAQLAPVDGHDRPVLTAEQVTDVAAGAVADPFLLQVAGLWYLFFEVWNRDRGRGEIAYATSTDLRHWHYGRRVLSEPFHLSYPQVVHWRDQFYMVPETRQDGCVRLYRAADFPTGWRCIAILLKGPFADATLWREQGSWWLFAQRGLDELRLYRATRLDGPWQEHPASPLWPGNRRRTRPGGRMVRDGNRLLRFAQDGWPEYGHCLRAFQVDRLDPLRYQEHEIPGSPILKATRRGWNALAMHHIDAVALAGGGWIAAVDGAELGVF